MLKRLFYVSMITVGTTPVDVQSIVSSSTIWNRRHDVTGLLLAWEANFAQVLEGRVEPMTRVMERIRRDPHHHAIEIRLDESITHRMFGRWSMACVRRNDLAEELRRLHASLDVALRDSVLDELARASRELSGGL